VAIFGIEGISKFENRRKLLNTKTIDIPGLLITFNGLVNKLLKAKPSDYKRFIKLDDACEELDLRDAYDKGGQDFKWAENVDIFFIFTHGNNDGNNALLAYNNEKNEWDGNSKTWKLGDSNMLKWLVLLGCTTINLKNPLGYSQIFANLHEICGFYELFTYSDDIGEDLGKDLGHNLTEGDTVADAWLDAATESDYNTGAIVISAEHRDTWNNGKPKWDNTTMNQDHLSGHGFTCKNISSQDKGWLCSKWVEWYIDKRVKKTRSIEQPQPKLELEISDF